MNWLSNVEFDIRHMSKRERLLCTPSPKEAFYLMAGCPRLTTLRVNKHTFKVRTFPFVFIELFNRTVHNPRNKYYSPKVNWRIRLLVVNFSTGTAAWRLKIMLVLVLWAHKIRDKFRLFAIIVVHHAVTFTVP